MRQSIYFGLMLFTFSCGNTERQDTIVPAVKDSVQPNAYVTTTTLTSNGLIQIVKDPNGQIVVKTFCEIMEGDTIQQTYYYNTIGRIVYYEEKINHYILKSNIVSDQISNRESGKLIYDNLCASCHGGSSFSDYSVGDSISFYVNFRDSTKISYRTHFENTYVTSKVTNADLLSVLIFVSEPVE
jgi:hypothetical protein